MITNKSNIIISPINNSRISEFNEEHIQFGKLYSDHMYIAKYEDNNWIEQQIIPYNNISLSPATTFFHYGQAIFEGIKAYKHKDDSIHIFRPEMNWERFNRSARRMAMPEVPREMFLNALSKLIHLDKPWVPKANESSLYIRPFMVASDEFIGVKPAEKFMFMIITSPAGPYYSNPISIYIQDDYVRAFPGGIGFTKAAGNYGASMYPTMKIKEMGYDQILWTDGIEHKYVQEIGTMNVFFIIDNKIVTPSINDCILEGVTRMSVITLLIEKGIVVEERPIDIEEIQQAYASGLLTECFGTGTAASIAPIQYLTYKENKMYLPDVSTWKITNWVKQELSAIRYGLAHDRHNWLYKIN